MALENAMMVNIERHSAAALESAKATAASYFERHGGDVTQWSPSVYHEFVWAVLISGLMRAANDTTTEYRRIIAGLDEIPY